MKIVIILVICCLNLIQIINSKYFRGVLDDEVLGYELDPKIPSYLAYFNLDHLILQQIDDDNVQVGGYLESTKTMNPNIPLSIIVKIFSYEKATWTESPLLLAVPNICSEFLSSQRFWYNATKLWTSCPAQKGDKWFIELQSLNVVFNFPPSFSALPYKAYIMVTQGIPGIETLKFGFVLKVEFVQV